MSNFTGYFERERAVEHEFGPVMKFNLQRNKIRFDHFIFVEGFTDRHFYINTSDARLSKNAFYLYREFEEGAVDDGFFGKKSVLYSLRLISENKELSKDLDKCIFIIDRDFDYFGESDLIPKSEKVKNVLYKTQGHSVENYLFAKNNLRTVLKSVNFQCDVNDFLNKFEEFVKGMSSYYAVNSEITGLSRAHNNRTVFYKHKYPSEEIMNFDFSKEDFWLGRNKAQEETELMQQQILGKQVSVDFADKKKSIIENNIMFVRGHDAFAFMYQYIKQKFNKDFDIFEMGSDYRSLIKELFIEFEKVST